MTIKLGPGIVQDGLVFYFDAANPRSNAGGTVSYDLSPSRCNMTWNAAPVLNTSNLGSVATNVSAFATGSKTVLPSNGYSAFTLEAWVYQTNTSPTWQMFLGTVNTATEIGTNSGSFAMGRDGGAGGLLVTGIQTLTPNTWYQVAMVYDGNLANTAAAYVNGDVKLTGQNIGSKGNAVLNGPPLLGVFSPNSEWFNGNIAIARVYNRALSNAEVRANYDAHRSRFGL
jgi:hypothetical protein